MSASTDLAPKRAEEGTSVGVKVMEHAEKCAQLGKMLDHAASRQRSVIDAKYRMNMRTGEPTGYSVTYDLGRKAGLLEFKFCPFCGVPFL